MKFLDTAIEAANAGGNVLQAKYMKSPVTINAKQDKTFVTDADLETEKVIIQIISDAFPDHTIFSEESGLSDKNSEYTWIIDPLDGTSNFLHQLNHFSVSIALTHNSQPIIGVVYDPIRDEMFSAEKDKGAHLNNQPIKPNDITQLSEAMLLLDTAGVQSAEDRFGQAFSSLIKPVRTFRVLRSSNLTMCYIARGRAEAIINFESKSYDWAAGIVIANEAGCHTSDFQNLTISPKPNYSSDVLISNKQLSAQLLELVKDV